MKAILSTILTVFILATVSCRKNRQDASYKDVPRVMFAGSEKDKATTDSTLFSFTTLPLTTTTYDLTLVVKIMGQTATVDRTFLLGVQDSGTTALPAEYELPASFVLKAGEILAHVPITVKKSGRIDSMNVKLIVNAVSNDFFETSELSTYRFVWSNDVVKPRSWESTFINYVGKYSKAKHRLMLASTPYKDLNLIDYNISNDFNIFGTVIAIRDQSAKALKAFNEANPGKPLRNEEGNVIAICRNCE